MMNNKIFFSILVILIFGQTLIGATDESTGDQIRNGRILGLSGYFSSSSNGIGVLPFWRQWNALLQINIEKNRHKHVGAYFVPGSLYYYPQNGNGVPLPADPSFYENGFPFALRPMPLLFDDLKPSTTTMASNADEEEIKAKRHGKDDTFKTILNDERKTRKRDALCEHNNGDETVASVVEITEETTDQTTELSSPTTEAVDSSTEISMSEQSTTQAATTTVQPVKLPEQSSSYYWGGTPNLNANFIQITTDNSIENLIPPANSDSYYFTKKGTHKFKPSIQYEFHDYPYNIGSHFVPVNGVN